MESNPPKLQIIKHLGKGSFGTVWLAKMENEEGNILVAVKRVNMDKADTYLESEMVSKLSHKNIIQLLCSFYSYNPKGVGHLNMVFEYVSDKTLYDLIYDRAKRMDVYQILNVFQQVLSAVKYLHRNKIAHRDLKPANIIVTEVENFVKLIDFGHAKCLDNSKERTVSTCYCISRFYRAPELLLGNTQYGVQVDIWSLGCIFVEMLMHTPLFPGENEVDQMMKVIGLLGSPTLEDIKSMAPHVRDPSTLLPDSRIEPIDLQHALGLSNCDVFFDFISTMLVYNPKKRATASQLLDHPIFALEE